MTNFTPFFHPFKLTTVPHLHLLRTPAYNSYPPPPTWSTTSPSTAASRGTTSLGSHPTTPRSRSLVRTAVETSRLPTGQTAPQPLPVARSGTLPIRQFSRTSSIQFWFSSKHSSCIPGKEGSLSLKKLSFYNFCCYAFLQHTKTCHSYM